MIAKGWRDGREIKTFDALRSLKSIIYHFTTMVILWLCFISSFMYICAVRYLQAFLKLIYWCWKEHKTKTFSPSPIHKDLSDALCPSRGWPGRRYEEDCQGYAWATGRSSNGFGQLPELGRVWMKLVSGILPIFSRCSTICGEAASYAFLANGVGVIPDRLE